MIKIFFAIAILSVCGAVLVSWFNDPCKSTVYVELGPYELCIPKYNAQEVYQFNPFSMIPGLDEQPPNKGQLLFFSTLGFKAAIDGFQIEKRKDGSEIHDDLVLINYLTDIEIERTKHMGLGEKDIENLWFGEGNWEGRKIESIEDSDWYRACWSSECKSWQILSEFPDRNANVHKKPNFLIASCHINSFGKISCMSNVLIENMKLGIGVNGNESNMAVRNKVANYIATKIRERKVN